MAQNRACHNISRLGSRVRPQISFHIRTYLQIYHHFWTSHKNYPHFRTALLRPLRFGTPHMSKLVWYDYNPAAGILQARYTPPAPPRTITPPRCTFTWHTNTGKEPRGYIEVRQRKPKRRRQPEYSGALSVCNDEGEEVLAVPLSAHAVDLLDVDLLDAFRSACAASGAPCAGAGGAV